MGITELLSGISPLWWVVIALVLGAVEMTTMSFFLIWPALAALIMAVLLALVPGLSGSAQLALFAVLAIGLTLVGRRFMGRIGESREDAASALNRRGSHLIGQVAKVLECTDGVGAVEVEGMRWRAHWKPGHTANPGDTVKITAVNGMDLTVE